MAADKPPPAGKKNLSPALRFWRRIGIAIGGGLLVLAGVILSLPLVPGPGFAVILLGLGVLSLEFERPRKWMAALKHRFKDLAQRVRGKSSSGD